MVPDSILEDVHVPAGHAELGHASPHSGRLRVCQGWAGFGAHWPTFGRSKVLRQAYGIQPPKFLQRLVLQRWWGTFGARVQHFRMGFEYAAAPSMFPPPCPLPLLSPSAACVGKWGGLHEQQHLRLGSNKFETDSAKCGLRLANFGAAFEQVWAGSDKIEGGVEQCRRGVCHIIFRVRAQWPH